MAGTPSNDALHGKPCGTSNEAASGRSGLYIDLDERCSWGSDTLDERDEAEGGADLLRKTRPWKVSQPPLLLLDRVRLNATLWNPTLSFLEDSEPGEEGDDIAMQLEESHASWQ